MFTAHMQKMVTIWSDNWVNKLHFDKHFAVLILYKILTSHTLNLHLF